MIKLLQVEIKKILKKKSIYIIWSLMLIFCILNNILYFTDYDEDGNYKYSGQDILEDEQKQLENELAKYNKDDNNQVTMYITIKTKLDILSLKQDYPQNSWQYKKIHDYLYDSIYLVNYYKYVEKDNDQLISQKNEYQQILNNLNSDNYNYFLNKEIEKVTESIQSLEETYLNETNTKILQDLKQQIKENKFNLKILNYRLTNDIKEDNSYLNSALEIYQEQYKSVQYYNQLTHKMTHHEKVSYQNALKELAISKYIVENKININKENTLNYQLRTIIEDYEIFLVILILTVCGIIICDEFKDGTIKLLLIKPYSRCKILLSKYLTVFVIVGATVLLLIIFQFVIGGIVFGFDSLEIPVVIYDFNNSKLLECSIYKYMLIRIIARTPFLIMMIMLSVFLGVVSNSVIISITLPLLLYMFNSTLIYLMNQYQLKFMKYMANINWNIQENLFGKLSEIPYIDLNFSIIVLLIYFISFIILTFWLFKKKDIKNI